jgi:3-deoxy-D-manno-octulosonic-acid transferase
MEPALYAKPIVVGPSMKNFAAIMDDFLARGGVRQIAANETDKEAQKQQLTDAFAQLFHAPAARETMGAAARSVFDGSKGATQFTVDRIAAIYEEVLKR